MRVTRVSPEEIDPAQPPMHIALYDDQPQRLKTVWVEQDMSTSGTCQHSSADPAITEARWNKLVVDLNISASSDGKQRTVVTVTCNQGKVTDFDSYNIDTATEDEHMKRIPGALWQGSELQKAPKTGGIRVSPKPLP
jgi:hypothetical protein